MTLQDSLRKHLGWCPRFDLPSPALFSPFPELTISRRVAAIIVLIGWGLASLITGIRLFLLNVPGRLDLLYSPTILRAFLWEILYLPTGLAILILVADFVAAGRVMRRHRVELVVAVTLGSLLRISQPLFDLVDWVGRGVTFQRFATWASWPPSVIASVENGSVMVFLLALTIYLAYRVYADKPLLTRGKLLLMAPYFLWVPFSLFYGELTNGWPMLALPPLELTATLTEYLGYLIIGIFFVATWWRLRRGGGIVHTPAYLRIALFLFGAVGVLYDLQYFLSSGYGYWDRPWTMLVGIVTRSAIIYLAVYPLKFTVGEVKATTPPGGGVDAA